MVPQEVMARIIEKVVLITDPGLDIEMQDFYTWYEVVDTYSIKITDDNIYKK